MIDYLQPFHLFLTIILIIGCLTIGTDIRYKKIYNTHLILGAGLGLIAVFFTMTIKAGTIVPHLTNGVLAFLLGWLFYHYNIWRGGDAKLFALYAFLMPSITHTENLISHAVKLFACTFIFGAIIFTPIFIKDILSNYLAIRTQLLSKRDAILQSAMTAMVFSWILFPIYSVANQTNPFIVLIISYLLYIWGYDHKEKKGVFWSFLKQKRFELSFGILLGCFLRLWISPHSLTWPALILSFMRVGIFVTVSAFIHTALSHLRTYKDRIAFAPLLFTGLILSYTPFLAWLTDKIYRWNALFYR
jgi:Flp pilus assembly protein protease CpaA